MSYSQNHVVVSSAGVRLALLATARKVHDVQRLWIVGLAICSWLWGVSAWSEDRVELTAGKDDRSTPVLRGEIVDILGGQVRVRRMDGREDVVPWGRVKKIHTTWPERMKQGDALLAQGKYLEAVEAFRAASAQDTRAWIKRDLAARACVAFREGKQIKKAGELFLSIYKSDPATPHWEALPLVWMSLAADPDLEAAAARWLTDVDSPPAVLLGASCQVSLGNPRQILEPLQRLTNHREPRIALLAEAQLWRVRLGTSAESDVESWEKIVRRMPMSLRAGPYFVVGQAWARLNQHDRASLAWMRIPIDYPGQHSLAMEALERTASQLEQQGQVDKAAQLRRERTSKSTEEMPP